MLGSCDRCGSPIPISGVGRTRRYCSDACKQSAYRERSRSRSPIPAAMLSAHRWVRHISKRPVTITGSSASSTNSSTWTDYASASASAVGDGLGFCLGDGFACIDIDHCIVDGVVAPIAVSILERFPDAYVEVSPSGHGLHVWGTSAPIGGRCFCGYEVYTSGRYITITGNVYRAGGLPDISSAISGGRI